MRSILCAGLLMLAVFGAVLSSCQSGDLDVGQNVIQPNGMSVSLIDTMTVNAYTIMSPDSFATSSDGTLLICNWTNA